MAHNAVCFTQLAQYLHFAPLKGSLIWPKPSRILFSLIIFVASRWELFQEVLPLLSLITLPLVAVKCLLLLLLSLQRAPVVATLLAAL